MSDQAQQDDSAPDKNAAPVDAANLTRAEHIFVRISILQTILAVAGVFTGAVALYAALSEADAVRKQQQAAVWPHVRVSDYNIGLPGEERFDVIVGNRGIGPALIKYVKLTVDDEEQLSWFDVIAILTDDKGTLISNYPLANEVIASNENISAVSIDAATTSAELTIAFRDLVRSGRANMEICYCSVFDDCWLLDALTSETTAIQECPAQNPESRI